MQVFPIEINWNPDMPIFSREQFLKAVGDEYGWLGGFREDGKLEFILPYTIIKKAFLRLVRFRVETIKLNLTSSLLEEKEFLNSCVNYFRSKGADVIMPATTNSIFQTFPDGAIAAPYGTYIIDLKQSEETLWKNIERITRQNIKRATKLGVMIEKYAGPLEPIYKLIRSTFKRSSLPFMDFNSFTRFCEGLAEYGQILRAHLDGEMQSCVVFAYSNYCAYAVYAGNADHLVQGANKLLYWEAICHFKNLGVRRYDFVGTRINPAKGSKQEALSTFKKHFGCTLVQGYIWKYPLNRFKYNLYSLGAKLRSGGDIVDAEKHKMKYYKPDLTSALSTKDQDNN
ncbi:MAG: peptidoglycan bridge formation glycyltransferase FemA/FemB family protein [Candidatus Aminicenantes bacterium]|nr:peptidoglycan bridge formation glycyltransferase FemA/FemB family protein [Candidatus Aminicenantes bacterium]